ncbi:hypothetical protein BDZ91DRAFT_848550 [Kalaharituber pfeilii]|nr:hypothetical protein BDZ91DRAFT_848550 [Kalaharituber pfeilii]
MPVRVSQAPGSSSLTNSYPSNQPRASPASSRGGEDSSSVDSRQRRRLQRTPSQSNTMTRSSSSLKSSLKEPPSPQKPPRSSGRDRKPATSLKQAKDHSIVGIRSNNASTVSVNSTRGFLHPPESTSNVTTFYAFGQNTDEELESTEFEFSPSLNLEDVHRSIISDETDLELSQFPLPGRNITGSVTSTVAGSSHSGSASVIRRPSLSKFSSSGLQQEQAARQRRTSNAAGTITKGVGDNTAARATQRRRPSIASSLNSNNSLTPPMPNKEYLAGSSRNGSDARIQVASNVNRNTKAKSLQPPPRPQVTTSTPLKPTLTPEHARPSSFSTAPKSPNSPNVRLHKSGLPTPGATRRISTIPHASGLGARTISPTDARRLKRLSTIKTPPPPAIDSQRSTPASPSLIPRKSITPSSSTNTPEPMRKSYSSGLSNTSTVPSARTSTGSLQPRLSQNLSLSRLPTAKSSRQSNEEDEIPPVPPLPKSLVSPAVVNCEFPEPIRDSLLPPEPPKHRELPSIKPEFEVPPEPTSSTASTRRRRGMTLGTNKAAPTLEPKASVSSLNKKNLAPLRLPPLNLLPLSTPTIARVNALGNTSDPEELTPPRRHGMKTPSTPMTASKASFFGRSSAAEGPIIHQRSTSSINHIPSRSSPSSASYRVESSSSSNIPISASGAVGRHAISPYISSSLPKQSLDYGQGLDENPVPEIKSSSKILGLPLPRDKSRNKKHKDEVPSQERETPDTPPSGSLRRKLSLSWKRGTKSSHGPSDKEPEVAPPKYDGMPPPRLPASATWGAGTVSTPSPSKTGHGRRKSIISISSHDRTKSESWSSSTTGSPRREAVAEKTDEQGMPPPQYQAYQVSSHTQMGPPPPPPPPSSSSKASSNSILSPVQKMLSNKSSLGQMRRPQPPIPVDPTLDADDLIAEEEMRKLAAKRKNLESAAQELEELKRRAVPKEKMTPSQACRIVNLNIFERGEIVDYKDIYFCGTESAKKHIGDLSAQAGANFGYDDDRGDYLIVKGDHLGYRYEIIDVLGKGSFGQVVRCVDHKTGGLVAIKIIRNKKRFHQQALVEVNILQKLKEWDPHKKHSLISFTQSFYFRGHLCISTELLGMNLYEFIKSNDFRGFSLRLIRRFTKQLLSSLVLLKGHRVIHCDLKPENVLLASPNKGEIRVIDFGSSCFEHEKVYTYIQSRFYRSPEVILGMTYGLPIDMWSLGCILAELYTGYPIFPGENEQEQLACIMEVFGPPEKHLIEKSTRKKLFFDSFGKPRVIVSSKGRRRRPSSKTLSQALKCDDEAFLDFIARCLRWDPDKRLKPDEAMHHDFITGRKTISRSRGNPTQPSEPSTIRSRFGNSSNYSVAGSRPLPEPPTTNKITHKPSGHLSHMQSSSPSKSYVALGNSTSSSSAVNGVGTSNHLKRHSTVSSTASGSTKRNSIGGAAGSSLPRVASTRTTSGKVGTPPISNGTSKRR